MRRRPARRREGRPLYSPRRALLCLAILGCSASTAEPRLTPSLASTTASARAFERIRELWPRTSEPDRPGLRRDLDAFLAAYPTDGLAPVARVYLALSFMSPPEDWQRAETLLRTMPEPAPGTAHDLYLVAVARDLRHHHDASGAYGKLQPLVGKMVDATARGLLEEEVSLDALEADRPYEAIAYMDAWIRGASEEGRDAVRAKVARVLVELPESALSGSLRAMRSAGGSGSRGYGQEIQRLVARRLADIALDRGDATLARWLLDPDAGGAPRVGGDAGVALAELATSKRGLGNVSGRTLGLVLPTESPELRDEAADVARGVAWALELPRTDPRAGDGIRLATRDDTGEPDRLVASLEEIAGEGASIVIAGLDGASAKRAIEWAEPKHLALLVLAPPEDATAGGFSFILGQPLAPVVDAVVDAIARRHGKQPLIAPVVEGDAASGFVHGFRLDGPWRAPVSCDVQSTKAGEPRFPIASWAASGVRDWLLLTSAECAADVIHEVGPRVGGAVFGLGLEAAGLLDRAGSHGLLRPSDLGGARCLAASAGVLPLGTRAGDPREAEAGAMLARLGGRPSWWAALGRDAGTLARKALATLPEDTVTAEADITKRRKEARDALAEARARLWTTDAEGFSGSAAIPRDVRVVELR